MLRYLGWRLLAFQSFTTNLAVLCLKCKLCCQLQQFNILGIPACLVHILLLWFFFRFFFRLLKSQDLDLSFYLCCYTYCASILKTNPLKKNWIKAFINMDILYEQMYVCISICKYVHIYLSFYLLFIKIKQIHHISIKLEEIFSVFFFLYCKWNIQITTTTKLRYNNKIKAAKKKTKTRNIFETSLLSSIESLLTVLFRV